MGYIVITIINCETGEVVEREQNAKEIKQQETDSAAVQAASDLQQSEAEANATAKTALLARLGITADEATLLLS
jgi:hypothetical protein